MKKLIDDLLKERDERTKYLRSRGTPEVEVLAYRAGMNRAIEVVKTNTRPRIHHNGLTYLV